MVTIIVVLIAAAICVFQLPIMMRNRWIKETAVFVVFLVAGSIMSVIAWKMITVPSPLKLIVYIYKPINQFLELMFRRS
ncbi:hypothetical protein ACFOQM_04335 [Paenibacillus sp. GCM10012307]|uniref:Uncharacterized protein n=1 Tax=Paenibacillus roseus TaxID=2798579 RepID=A0A934IWE4_9BACL|nr:hypothetical protein [Paenibacillus roseus]MBJ6360542.1 hypothetical protein [Paenibacillus roseus]